MPEEAMHGDVGGCTIVDPYEAFLQLMNLLYCGLLNKEHKILLGLQVTSFPGKGCLFTCKVDG